MLFEQIQDPAHAIQVIIILVVLVGVLLLAYKTAKDIYQDYKELNRLDKELEQLKEEAKDLHNKLRSSFKSIYCKDGKVIHFKEYKKGEAI